MAVGDARISIAPTSTDRINEPGNKTFIVTLQKDTGAGFVAAVGETVAVAYGEANGAVAQILSPTIAVTNGSGQAFFVTNSASCGIVTASASASLIVLGVPKFVSTNGVVPNSAPAQSFYVDARLSFTQILATNNTGVGHTWTVFVEKNLGDGNGYIPAVHHTPAGSNVTVTVTLTNIGGAVASPTGPFSGNTNGSGLYTSTSFTSASTGQVRARASATVTNIFGISITVATRFNERWGSFADPSTVDPSDAIKSFI